jgi:hypothetical protein
MTMSHNPKLNIHTHTHTYIYIVYTGGCQNNGNIKILEI